MTMHNFGVERHGGRVQSLSFPMIASMLIFLAWASPKLSRTMQATLEQSDADPQVSVAQKELIATEKAEEEARQQLREAEDQAGYY